MDRLEALERREAALAEFRRRASALEAKLADRRVSKRERAEAARELEQLMDELTEGAQHA